MKNTEKFLVSIHCITYNQKDYIRQCLDGFVMQKTNFKFVAYVGDDCSTDGTTEIVREYEQKYPDIIKGVYHSENTGGEQNFFDVANMCKTKYVAICEGDDYWTDPYKLQKQVDYLEEHSEYSACFHPVRVKWENGKGKAIYPSKTKMKWRKFINLKDLLKVNYIQTNSVVYRWRNDIPDIFPKGILPADHYLHLLHAQVGDIGFLPEVMSVYRKHSAGIWFDKKNLHAKYGENEIAFYHNVYKNITNASNEYLCQVYLPFFRDILDSLFTHAEFVKIENIYKQYKDIFVEAFKNGSSSEIKYKKYKKLFNIFLFMSVIMFLLNLLQLFWHCNK